MKPYHELKTKKEKIERLTNEKSRLKEKYGSDSSDPMIKSINKELRKLRGT